MENSVGFMTVFAVSGSVVLVALQAHKRLLSDFMKKVELELGGIGKVQSKKKVRFADDVLEPSSNNKEYRKQRSRLIHDRSSSGNNQCRKLVPAERILKNGGSGGGGGGCDGRLDGGIVCVGGDNEKDEVHQNTGHTLDIEC
ncbi:hypothetical protein BVC80_1289g135 [Macleaya cordata]|uniref:Transmembrane protein n=1 Tax=Macleaya cordata TaxID=56857 RepID=A0A200Q9X9_MACCD|nr:hypothetical protein BVC80_1289g135 [Macleaya cordata]